MAATLRDSGEVLACGLALFFAGSTALAEDSPASPAVPPLHVPLILKKFAGDVFNLDDFKLLIPLDDDGDGIADEVKMPLLRNFEDPAFFHINKTGEAIVFRAQSGEARMEGSLHPRCEMWELKKGTETHAAWGTNGGPVHNLTITLAFTRLPADGTPLVAAAVHGESGEILAVRHEDRRVILSRSGLDPLVLDPAYVAGRPLDLMIILDQGRVRAFRDLKELAEWPLVASGLQFRAGVVLETKNPESGDPKLAGEVSIWKLYITHK